MKMQHRHSPVVYGSLIAAAALAAAGLVYEHNRTIERERQAVLDRARNIAVAVSTVIRSESRFTRGIVWQPRLEAALNELTTDDRDLRSVALINTDNEPVASAGPAIDFTQAGLSEEGYHWGEDIVTVVEVVALGQIDNEEGRPPIIVIEEISFEGLGGPDGRRPPRGPDGERRDGDPGRGGPGPMQGPGSEPRPEERRGDGGHRSTPPRDYDSERPGEQRRGGPPREFFSGGGRPDGEGGFRSDPRRGSRFYPWWRLDESARNALRQKGGVHGFVLALSTSEYRIKIARDLRLRLSLGGIVVLAVLGIGFAWHNFARSSELQLRLLRAGEMNTHLREMNLAAAGLAHETRNPLNIIRGLAQLISQQDGIADETREKTRDITDEVDRVTNRLNQFIDYSRPPEPRPVKTDILSISRDVSRTLDTDREDKDLRVDIEGPALEVLADESLLRQILFNLLLNAIQAVEEGGRITIAIAKNGKDEAAFEVRDDGPGIPADAVEEIFRPYYTGSSQGTGLGLAIVRQLVLAHQWEIAYTSRPEGGASFRVGGIKIA